MSILMGVGLQVTKFEQVSSNDHQMSVSGGKSHVWCPGGGRGVGESHVWCPVGEGAVQ